MIVVCVQVVIPFFSLFVKDLYFLNEGCTNRQADGNVNFEVAMITASSSNDYHKTELSESFHGAFVSSLKLSAIPPPPPTHTIHYL